MCACNCCAPSRSLERGAPSGNGNDFFHHLHYPILGIAFIEEALGGPGSRNPITDLTIRQKAEPSVNVSISQTQSFDVQYPATPDGAQRNTWASDLGPRSLHAPDYAGHPVMKLLCHSMASDMHCKGCQVWSSDLLGYE